MKTTFATFTLYLLVCVAGSHAAQVDRRLKQDQASPSTMCFEFGPALNLVSILSDALDPTGRIFKDRTTGVSRSAKKITPNIARAFARFFQYSLDMVDEQSLGGECKAAQLSSATVATPFSTAVRTAASQSGNRYIKAAADCFSKAVERATSEVLRNVVQEECNKPRSRNNIYPLLSQYGYENKFSNSLEHVIAAFRVQDIHIAAFC